MKLKNIFVCSCFATAMLFHSIAANAAVISIYPYFQDFEDVGDVTLTDSLWDESQTALDCVFYALGDELTAGVDEESPEHGKVLKHISKGNSQKFILWKFPTRTEGIVAISLDLKHHDERMLYMKFSSTIWDPILKMDDNEYALMDYPDIGKSGQYSKDEWNHIQIAINLDEGLKTISFNGDTYTSAFGEATLREFYIQMQGDTMPDSEFTEIFIDNVKIEVMDTTADTALFSDGKEIEKFTGETDELSVKITDNESDTVNLSAEDIIFIDLGDNPIAIEENKVEFTTEAKSGELKIKTKSKLKDGHRYRLILPEDAKTRFTRNLSETEFEFSVGADGGAAAGAANLSRVIFTDADENADVYIKGSKLAPATKSIALYFSGSINEESLEDITVSNGDENEDFDISYIPDSNLCVLTLDNYLKANSEYEIIIPESVTGQEIKGSFVTDSGAYEVKTIEFLDASGNKTENISSAKNLKVSIINTLGESKKLSMVYSSHEGYYLKNMSFKNMEITPDIRKAEFIMPINAAENATKLQGFLVSDIKSVVPQNGYVQIGG